MRTSAIAGLLVLTASFVAAQSIPGLELTDPTIAVLQQAVFPTGRTADYYDPGLGIGLAGTTRWNDGPVGLLAFASYAQLPIATRDHVGILGAGFGPRVVLQVSPRIGATAFGTLGYHVAAISDGGGTGTNLSYQAGLGASYRFGRFVAGLDVVYREDTDALSSIRVGARFAMRPRSAVRLGLSDPQVEPLFPVLYRYYERAPVGQVILSNPGPDPVEDLEVTFLIDGLMDRPTVCPTPSRVHAGQSEIVGLRALLANRVLAISEGDAVSGEVVASYTRRGRRHTEVRSVTVTIHGRNAMQWDDDRKAAAYVTARSPEVLTLARNVVRWTEGERGGALDRGLRYAMALFEALRLHGVAYAPDPTTPYVVYSRRQLAIDFLQFPSETLRYGVGDCDDLSILYTALLESVGIETAFLTTPGHIFVGVRIEDDADPLLPGLPTVEFGGASWIPVEVTRIADPFVEAWRTGARLWAEAVADGTEGFVAVREAWESFPPVDLTLRGDPTELPPAGELVFAYRRQYEELGARVIETTFDRYAGSGGSADGRAFNRAGVAAARLGLYEEARRLFHQARESGRELSALINLGHLYYLQQDFAAAVEAFRSAEALSPSDPRIERPLARAHRSLGRSPGGTEAARDEVAGGSPATSSVLRGAEMVEEATPWVVD